MIAGSRRQSRERKVGRKRDRLARAHPTVQPECGQHVQAQTLRTGVEERGSPAARRALALAKLDHAFCNVCSVHGTLMEA